MRLLFFRGVIGAFLLSACFFAATDASASSIHSREISVIIEAIDRHAHALSLIYEQGRGPQKVIWNKKTDFVCNGKFVTDAKLKEGTRAIIYYRSPFFGKPFATKIVWTTVANKI
ncbi:MAG: hypothetical protein M3Y82_11525 [Verrucomicrobiota bacterium]|nr:hypothetical protein [Verrucomicrobiota bacterium]